jgi:hypothetical protein
MMRQEGKGQEESSFCEQKEAKKLYSFGVGSIDQRTPYEESFFAYFFSKKEDSCFPSLLRGRA